MTSSPSVVQNAPAAHRARCAPLRPMQPADHRKCTDTRPNTFSQRPRRLGGRGGRGGGHERKCGPPPRWVGLGKPCGMRQIKPVRLGQGSARHCRRNNGHRGGPTACAPMRALVLWPSFGPHNLNGSLGWYVKPARAPTLYASLLPAIACRGADRPDIWFLDCAAQRWRDSGRPCPGCTARCATGSPFQ